MNNIQVIEKSSFFLEGDFKGVIIITCLIVCFTGIIDRVLWTPDEPRVAAVSLEMSRTGNYIVPHLAGIPFVEKPPLYFAAAGIAIKFFRNHFGVAGAARFSTALWGLGVLFFTGLTARRLFGGKSGIITVAILATMAGFVENFHWIRTDTALAFFVIAAVWGFIEGFMAQNAGFFILSGVFSAGAFLTKGFIGPLLIFIPLIGLLISRKLYNNKIFGNQGDVWAIFSGTALFITIILLWIAQFKLKTDSSTWYEWFHVNQLGRFTGESTHKGHMHPNDPLYYLKTILLYSMPWMPFVVGWFVKTLKSFRTLSSHQKSVGLFLLLWGFGSYLILSLPASKRDVYLLPALPAYAIMASAFIDSTMSKWSRIYSWFIACLCIFLLAILSLLPLVVLPFLHSIPQNLHIPISEWTYRNVLCCLAFSFCVWIVFRFKMKKVTHAMCIFMCSALLYAGALLVPMHIVDIEKNIKPGVHEFLSHVPESQRNRIAGWNFSETMLGSFYVYGNWKVPQIKSRENLNKIIAGQDEQYESIIMNQVLSIPDLVSEPYELLLEGHPRSGRKKHRGIYWIKGSGNETGM